MAKKEKTRRSPLGPTSPAPSEQVLLPVRDISAEPSVNTRRVGRDVGGASDDDPANSRKSNRRAKLNNGRERNVAQVSAPVDQAVRISGLSKYTGCQDLGLPVEERRSHQPTLTHIANGMTNASQDELDVLTAFIPEPGLQGFTANVRRYSGHLDYPSSPPPSKYQTVSEYGIKAYRTIRPEGHDPTVSEQPTAPLDSGYRPRPRAGRLQRRYVGAQEVLDTLLHLDPSSTGTVDLGTQ